MQENSKYTVTETVKPHTDDERRMIMRQTAAVLGSVAERMQGKA